MKDFFLKFWNNEEIKYAPMKLYRISLVCLLLGSVLLLVTIKLMEIDSPRPNFSRSTNLVSDFSGLLIGLCVLLLSVTLFIENVCRRRKHEILFIYTLGRLHTVSSFYFAQILCLAHLGIACYLLLMVVFPEIETLFR